MPNASTHERIDDAHARVHEISGFRAATTGVPSLLDPDPASR
jgi:hypothetical protein